MPTPPGFDVFELIEYYTFKIFLLVCFLFTLYEILKRKLKD